jgi:hypothetical protein
MEMSLGLKIHALVFSERTVIKTAVSPYYHAVTLVAKFSARIVPMKNT